MSRPDSWMPLHIQDWRSGTLSFTATERGAYMELILAYWELGPLPADDSVLEGLAKCRGKEWKQVQGQGACQVLRSKMARCITTAATKSAPRQHTRYSKRATRR
jgi:hypothetical protein